MVSQFRGLGTAIGIAAFWASSVLTNQFLWTMVERLTPSGACGVVAGTSILALVFVKYMVRPSFAAGICAINLNHFHIEGSILVCSSCRKPRA